MNGELVKKDLWHLAKEFGIYLERAINEEPMSSIKPQ